MATFAPELPSAGIPDFTKTSHPVTQPEADQSGLYRGKATGMALSTVGEGIEGGAKIAEAGAEDYLREKVHAGVDALRDATTLAYEDVRKSQITGTQPSEQAVRTAGFSGSLVKGEDATLPPGLESGLDKVTQLGLAKSQGKANDTLYTGALNAMAKQLRAQYPGHRDFIDEQIARISGINPANAYMQNLLTDINRASTGQDVFQKQIMEMAKANFGDPGVQKYWLALQHNIPGAMEGLVKSVGKAETAKWQHVQHQAEAADNSTDLAADSKLAANQYEVRAETITQRHLDGVLEIPGLDKKVTMNDIVSGNVKLDPDQKTQLLQNFVHAQTALQADLQRSADAEGYARRINDGGATADAVAKRQVAYIQRMIDTVTNDKYGTMYETKRRLDNINNTANVQALTGPLGEWLIKSKIISEHTGSAWTNLADSINLAQGDRLGQLRDWFGNRTQLIGAPDGDRGNATLAGDLNAAREAKKNGIKAPDAIYDDLVGNIKYLLKSQSGEYDPQIGKQIVKYMYGPGNEKIMDFFGKDMGQNKGRAYVYDVLHRPDTTDLIWNMKDPDAWRAYKNNTEKSFQIQFKDEMQDLNGLQGNKNFPVKINWNSSTHEMDIVNTRGRPMTPMEWKTAAAQNPYIEEMQRSVKVLNRGLQTLAYMHDKEGSDTNEYLWDTLMDMGYSPNDRVHGDVLPQRVMNAIQASTKTNKERLEEAFSAAKSKKSE